MDCFIETQYIIPSRSLDASRGERISFTDQRAIDDFIAHPEAYMVDGNPVSGGILPAVLAVDKPLGMTSFKMVARVRWLLSKAIGKKRIKIGHAGTLDPLATGVMVVCLGRATKQIEQMQAGEKEYLATVKLGATTPSFDLEQPVDATFPTAHITREGIEHALRGLEGDVMQVPPAFSACKVEGKRAYDLARSGQEVELRAKPVTIRKIELLACDLEQMTVDIRVVCSKGTYIRSIARDLGLALDSGAHLTALRRTRVGLFTDERCFTLEELEELYNPKNKKCGASSTECGAD